MTFPSSNEDRGTNRGRLAILLPYLAAAAFALFYAFRHFFLTGTRMVSGDTGDAFIVIGLLEHWRAIFAFRAADWTSPGFFHPVPGVLGNTDTHALMAPIYAVVRMFSDEWKSYELTLLATRGIGFASMALLLRDGLRVGHVWAAFGALLFTISAVTYARMGHAQLMGVSWVPLLFWFALNVLRAPKGTWRSWIGGLGLAVLLPLLLLTSFYMGWYLIVLFLWVALAALPLLAFHPGPAFRFAIDRWRLILCGAAAFAVSIVPFFVLYLPRLRESGGQPFSEALAHSQSLGDVVNAGPDNLVWGSVLSTRGPLGQYMTFYFSVTPLVLGGFLLAALWVWRARGRIGADVRWAVVLSSVAALLMWASLLAWPGFNPYRFYYEYVPGGSAMRVPARYAVFLTAVMAPVLAFGFDALHRRARSRAGAGLVACLAVFAAAEQHLVVWPAHIDRYLEGTRFKAIPPAPANCRSFYATGFIERPGVDPLLQYFYGPHVDSMIISARNRIPTEMGFSTLTPPGWDLMPTLQPGYDDKIRDWVRRFALTDVCRLDLSTREWTYFRDWNAMPSASPS